MLTVNDPMTNKTLVSMPCPNDQDILHAVATARSAFDSNNWPGSHPRSRASLLYKLAELVEQNLEVLALLEATDTGKRLTAVSAWDIPNAAEVYRYYAGWADKITGRQLPSPGGVTMFTKREPVGVCAAIIPWNFPFPCIAWKIAPALAAGCCVVVKTPERAPLSGQYLADLIQQAGFPPGVVNILTGIGEHAGRNLVSNPDVDKITFTGEAATASEIARSSVAHLPRLTLELGDKTPNVIMPDADLDVAVPAAVSAMFGVSGQNCCAGSRLLVDHAIASEVVERIATAAHNRILGDPLDDSTEQGPQIDRLHVKRIHSYVTHAVDSGAKCVVGGGPAGDGQFFAPTIITDATPDMAIYHEEVFGPVGTVHVFSGLDEAIRIANDRRFGLAAAIWTSDPKAAERFSCSVRTGTCWINCYEYFDTVAPWGGTKLSGMGRELGAEGLDEFLETKTVVRAI